MGIGLKNRGCLGCLSPSIERGELFNVQRAASRNEAVDLWDNITDWFCGTQKAEAKRLLFDICSTETASLDRVHSFYDLRVLAADEYKSHFYVTREGSDQLVYTVDIDGDGDEIIDFRAGFFEDSSYARHEGDRLID